MTRSPLTVLIVVFLAPLGFVQDAPKRWPIEVNPAGSLENVARGDQHFSPAWHAGRRKALVERIAKRREPADSKPSSAPENETRPPAAPTGVIVLRGAPARRDYNKFRQTNEFFYLTGVDAPGAALVIRVKDGKEVLFLAPLEMGEGVWLDIRPHAPRKVKASKPEETDSPAPRRNQNAEIQEASEALAKGLGFDDIREISDLDDYIDEVKVDGPIYTQLTPEEYEATSRDEAESFERAQEADPYDGRLSRTQQFKAKLGDRHGVEARDLCLYLDRLRRVKTPEEIEAMRVASKIASAGHIAAMRATRPGVKEWQIGAEATATFFRMGAPAISYFPIVGTGRNALILHYTDTGATVKSDDVILMDYAPEWHFYASDVTRSWPASGKFSEQGRKIYEAVLKAQEAAIAAVKPGVSFAAVNKAAMESLQADGFPPMQYMPHGLSHPIGMSTHDVGGIGKLEPGVVFTIEPGIYDRKSGIGVRIEDVIAVTATGADVLSRDCPKKVDEIEAIVGKPLRQ